MFFCLFLPALVNWGHSSPFDLSDGLFLFDTLIPLLSYLGPLLNPVEAAWICKQWGTVTLDLVSGEATEGSKGKRIHMLDGRYAGKDGPCRWVGRASRQLAEVFCSNWVDYWLRKRAPPPGPWPLSAVEHVVTSWWSCAGRLRNLQMKTSWRKCYWGWALSSSAMTTACGFSFLALHSGLAFLTPVPTLSPFLTTDHVPAR